jgi:hypothetical protein
MKPVGAARPPAAPRAALCAAAFLSEMAALVYQVTAGSALAHPVERVGAVEISPEVALAARLFSEAVELDPDNVQGYRGLREAARAIGDERLLARAEAMLARLGAS